MDARVASAIAHWAPRFVSNGVMLADFEEVTASIARWDDWCAAWSARAAVHERLALESLESSFLLTAGEHFVRAAIYYHFAKFVFVQDLAQMRAAHAKAVACYTAALPHLRPPGERVSIGRYKAVLRKPAAAGPCPVLVMAPGLDSTKEELHAYAEPFLARGIATLAFDGPGQGEAEYEVPICGDYEHAATEVVDWVSRRTDLDPERIAIWGVSLGGYYAPRAAAFEKRFKACIALSGPFDWAEIWEGLPELTRETFRVRSHSKTPEEARKRAAELTLEGCAGDLRCPLFIVAGRQDRLVPAAHAERLARRAAGPVELLMVEDGGHNANNRPYRYRSRSADWLAAQLRLPKL